MPTSPRTIRIKTPSSCPFCSQGRQPDYREFKTLTAYISERAGIIGKVRTGVCRRHQSLLTREIKRARYLGLLPFVPGI